MKSNQPHYSSRPTPKYQASNVNLQAIFDVQRALQSSMDAANPMNHWDPNVRLGTIGMLKNTPQYEAAKHQQDLAQARMQGFQAAKNVIDIYAMGHAFDAPSAQAHEVKPTGVDTFNHDGNHH